jgi:hypothetical protein
MERVLRFCRRRDPVIQLPNSTISYECVMGARAESVSGAYAAGDRLCTLLYSRARGEPLIRTEGFCTSAHSCLVLSS